jgi:ribosome-binding factor A
MTTRQEKMIKELRKLGSEFLSEISNRSSLITITRVDVSPDFKKATLFLSIFPQDKEHEAMAFIERRARDLRDHLKKHLRTKNIPVVTFEIDTGEKNRQRIDQLLLNS